MDESKIELNEEKPAVLDQPEKKNRPSFLLGWTLAGAGIGFLICYFLFVGGASNTEIFYVIPELCNGTFCEGLIPSVEGYANQIGADLRVVRYNNPLVLYPGIFVVYGDRMTPIGAVINESLVQHYLCNVTGFEKAC